MGAFEGQYFSNLDLQNSLLEKCSFDKGATRVEEFRIYCLRPKVVSACATHKRHSSAYIARGNRDRQKV